jgi:glycosyltransferase involved in cell wall biosynthesis
MLSVIIPCKNEEHSLPFVLRSLAAQVYRDFEVIVAVSPDTTDASREVAEGFGARVVAGGMPGSGRNAGARVAKGELLLFLDADVILPDPWFLQVAIGEFERRGLGIATCKIVPLSDKMVDKVLHEASNVFLQLMADRHPHAPGFFILARRAIHQAVGGFDESITLAEDHDFVSRARQHGKFALLKSCRIPVSVRRLDKDGRLNVAVKYVLVEFYLAVIGPIRSDLFSYRFAHFDEPGKGQGTSRTKAARQWRVQAAALTNMLMAWLVEDAHRSFRLPSPPRLHSRVRR